MEKISYPNMLFRLLLALVAVMVFLFIPAGSLNWPEAWLFMVIYFSWAGTMFVWFKKNNPELLLKRMSTKMPIKKWDKNFFLTTIIAFMIYFIIFGLDAVRFHWSNMPWYLELIGFIGIITSLYFIFLTMKENTFLSKLVEIQKNHQVITTGPYHYVRHPMYSSLIVMVFCLSLALGSWYSLIAGAMIVIMLIIRTYLEDKTLHQELGGYQQYSKKTSYKLLPGIW